MNCKNCGDECSTAERYCRSCSATKSNIRYYKRRVKELEEMLVMMAKNRRKNNEDI